MQVDETYELIKWALADKSAEAFHVLIKLFSANTLLTDKRVLAPAVLPQISSQVAKLLVERHNSKVRQAAVITWRLVLVEFLSQQKHTKLSMQTLKKKPAEVKEFAKLAEVFRFLFEKAFDLHEEVRLLCRSLLELPVMQGAEALESQFTNRVI